MRWSGLRFARSSGAGCGDDADGAAPSASSGRYFQLHERCPRCGYKFEREEGFFTGVYLVNYAVTALLLVVMIFAFLSGRGGQRRRRVPRAVARGRRGHRHLLSAVAVSVRQVDVGRHRPRRPPPRPGRRGRSRPARPAPLTGECWCDVAAIAPRSPGVQRAADEPQPEVVARVREVGAGVRAPTLLAGDRRGDQRLRRRSRGCATRSRRRRRHRRHAVRPRRLVERRGRPQARPPSGSWPPAARDACDRRDVVPFDRRRAAADAGSPVPPSTSPSTARMAPVGSAASLPFSMASTTRGANTMPSSSEFDARRLAPCTPLHAASPAAHSPGSDEAPSRSVTTPPHR